MKYTIGGNRIGIKYSLYGKSKSANFPMFSPHDGSCCIFPYLGKSMRKPMYFPYDKIVVDFFL